MNNRKNNCFGNTVTDERTTPAPPDWPSRIAFFDRLATVWDNTSSLEKIAPPLGAVVDTWDVKPAETILDVGCGTGNLTAVLLQRLGTDGRVVGLDISTVMLQHAKAKVNDPRATWLECPAEDVPLPEAVFHRIICFSVWPHFTAPATVLAEFYRLLKPNGYLHVLHLISRSAVNNIHSQASDPSIHHDLLPPVADLAVLTQTAGFKLITAAEDNSSYSLTATRPAS